MMKKIAIYFILLLIISSCNRSTDSEPSANEKENLTNNENIDNTSAEPQKESSLTAGAATKDYSVLDYYYLLPQELFFCDAIEVSDNQAFRESVIEKKNIKNGYILATPQGFDLQVALFKDRVNDRDIIAYSLYCGPGCMCNEARFVQLDENKQWKDVEGLFDEPVSGALVLPEFGTTIRYYDFEKFMEHDIRDSPDKLKHLLHFELKWEEGKFIVI